MADAGESAFWVKDKTQVLVAALKAVFAATMWDAPDLERRLRTLARNEQLPDDTALRRLRDGRSNSFQDKQRLTGLMIGLEAIFRTDDFAYDSGARAALSGLHAEFIAKHRMGSAASLPRDAFLITLAELLKIKREEIESVHRLFFASEDPSGQPLKFYMYRYAAKAGHIMKSYLEILPPAQGAGPCLFRHAARVPPGREVRNVEGIILPFGPTLSLVGPVADHSGLKIMTIDTPPCPQELYTGLVLSFDTQMTPIAARFVIRGDPKAGPTASALGSFPVAKVLTEIAPFMDELSNPLAADGQAALTAYRPFGPNGANPK